MTGFNLQLLGPVEASLDGRPIPLGATKQRAVLAMLGLRPNAAVSVDCLVDGLWGEKPPGSAQKMVQLYVSQLRKLLQGGDAEILTHNRGYELRVPPECVDAVRFERLVGGAAQNVSAPHGAAAEALPLWRGPPLHDLTDAPFAAAEIRRLEELWIRAREISIDAALEEGKHADAVGELQELVGQHPLREGLRAQLMLALYRCDRQADALQAYRDARALLVEELGLEPSERLRDLETAILAHDPELAAPAVAAEPAPALAGRLPVPPDPHDRAGHGPCRDRQAAAR